MQAGWAISCPFKAKQRGTAAAHRLSCAATLGILVAGLRLGACMKRIIAAALVLLAPAGASAQTPPPEYAWTQSRVSLTRAYAWAVKARPEQGFPQVMVLGRDDRAGTAPGEHLRSSAMFTFEVDCPKSSARVVEQIGYDSAFAETGREFRTPAEPG